MDFMKNNRNEQHVPGYIEVKAERYLKIGPEAYRKGDAFSLPSADCDEESLDSLHKGCTQILDGFGFSPDKSFDNLPIPGVYLLMNMFHFAPVSQKATTIENGFLDEMLFEHTVNEGFLVTVYNRVS